MILVMSTQSLERKLSRIGISKHDIPNIIYCRYDKKDECKVIHVCCEAGGELKQMFNDELTKLYENKYFMCENNDKGNISYLHIYFKVPTEWTDFKQKIIIY